MIPNRPEHVNTLGELFLFGNLWRFLLTWKHAVPGGGSGQTVCRKWVPPGRIRASNGPPCVSTNPPRPQILLKITDPRVPPYDFGTDPPDQNFFSYKIYGKRLGPGLHTVLCAILHAYTLTTPQEPATTKVAVVHVVKPSTWHKGVQSTTVTLPYTPRTLNSTEKLNHVNTLPPRHVPYTLPDRNADTPSCLRTPLGGVDAAAPLAWLCVKLTTKK